MLITFKNMLVKFFYSPYFNQKCWVDSFAAYAYSCRICQLEFFVFVFKFLNQHIKDVGKFFCQMALRLKNIARRIPNGLLILCLLLFFWKGEQPLSTRSICRMARKLECEKWVWTSLATWVNRYTIAKAKRQSWPSNVKKKKWKKKKKKDN